MSRPSTPHILKYLAQAAVREPNVWLADDYRIAWLTVRFAAQNEPSPWAKAFEHYLGGSPERLIPFFVARDYAGRYFPLKYLPLRYTKTWQEDFERVLRSISLDQEVAQLAPKKPPQPVSLPQKRKLA